MPVSLTSKPKYLSTPPNMALPTRLVEPNNTAQTFEAFFERWLIRQEDYLQALLQMMGCKSKASCRELVNEVLAHYGEYYEAKARVMHENAFLLFMPTWFSPLECAYLWIGGFKPELTFQFVIDYVLDLSEDQSQRMYALMAKVKEEERGLTDELFSVHDRMAAPLMVELAGHLGREMNGASANLESAVESLRSSLEAILECADLLRKRTVIKLMEILSPTQAVRFLAAAAQFQLALHR